MDMSGQTAQLNKLSSAPSFNEFDPLSGGGQRRPSANNFAQDSNSNPFGDFGMSTTTTTAPQHLQPSRTMDVSQAFGGVGQQRQPAAQNMAGLGQQVFQMGMAAPQGVQVQSHQQQQHQHQQQQQQQVKISTLVCWDIVCFFY